MDSQIYKKGSFGDRLIALIIDQAFLLILVVALSLVYQRIGSHIIFDILMWVLPIAYAIFFLGRDGQTPGKKFLRLKVTTLEYKTASFSAIFFRESIYKFLSSTVFNLGFLWALIDEKRRAWHDMLAKTYVVKTDTEGKLIPVSQEEKITTKQRVFFYLGFLIFGLPIPLLIAILLLYLFVAQPVRIVGGSMEPQYKTGQFYLVNKLEYRSNAPARGDVVIFKNPQSPESDFIQRIVGLPGETIKLEAGKVYINNNILEERGYLSADIYTDETESVREGMEYIVPDNHYFVLGDNREKSLDSRYLGFVPRGNIVGKVAWCYYNCK